MECQLPMLNIQIVNNDLEGGMSVFFMMFSFRLLLFLFLYDDKIFLLPSSIFASDFRTNYLEQ